MPTWYGKLHNFDETRKNYEKDRQQPGPTGLTKAESQSGDQIDAEMLDNMRHPTFRPHTGWDHRQNHDGRRQTPGSNPGSSPRGSQGHVFV
jgi:rRNA maturation protein Rpf1